MKTQGFVELAKRRVALGANGITCQKLGEAEVMVAAGIDDVLIPYNIVGEDTLERLVALGSEARLTVSFDDERLLPGLAGAARRSRRLDVLVDCDTGMGTGVATPEEAAALAGAVARFGDSRFTGFRTYPAPEGSAGFLSGGLPIGARERLGVHVHLGSVLDAAGDGFALPAGGRLRASRWCRRCSGRTRTRGTRLPARRPRRAARARRTSTRAGSPWSRASRSPSRPP